MAPKARAPGSSRPKARAAGSSKPKARAASSASWNPTGASVPEARAASPPPPPPPPPPSASSTPPPRRVPDHELLGIPSSSTEDVIKQRLRQLRRVHHPDRGGDAETFAVINTAGERTLEGARDPYASIFAFFGCASSSSSNIRTEVDMTPAEMEAKLRRDDAEAKDRIARLRAARPPASWVGGLPPDEEEGPAHRQLRE